jgi:hypothetical protein
MSKEMLVGMLEKNPKYHSGTTRLYLHLGSRYQLSMPGERSSNEMVKLSSECVKNL